MELGLAGKVALVAGASRGLGRAVAEALAAERVNLVLCARSSDDLTAAETAIQRNSGVEILARPTDVTKENEVGALVGLLGFGKSELHHWNVYPGGWGLGQGRFLGPEPPRTPQNPPEPIVLQ